MARGRVNKLSGVANQAPIRSQIVSQLKWRTGSCEVTSLYYVNYQAIQGLQLRACV